MTNDQRYGKMVELACKLGDDDLKMLYMSDDNNIGSAAIDAMVLRHGPREADEIMDEWSRELAEAVAA